MVKIPIRIGPPALLPHQAGNLEPTGVHLPQALQPAVIGSNLETSELVGIGDHARRSGLYILGKSGTGKTSLLARLIEQDIASGHGLFFLDPHGDGIEDLFSRHGLSGRLSSVLLFDPEDEKHSFGISPLACRDVSSLSERDKDL